MNKSRLETTLASASSLEKYDSVQAGSKMTVTDQSCNSILIAESMIDVFLDRVAHIKYMEEIQTKV